MIDFTIHTDIDRPVADVFAYATDPSLLRTWQANTVSVVQETAGPLREGSRLREVHRDPRGKDHPSIVEVAELVPNRTFELRVVEGIPVHARMTFEDVDDSTRVTFRAFGRLTGGMRLVQPLLQRTLRQQFTAHCERLKEVLEQPRPE